MLAFRPPATTASFQLPVPLVGVVGAATNRGRTMDYEHELAVAAAAFTALEKMHTDFMQYVSDLSDIKVNGGTLEVVDGELSAVVLGVHMRARHQPVVVDGRLGAVQYEFEATFKGKEVAIWSMYLEPRGTVSADPRGTDFVAGSRNGHLYGNVVARLASALMRSPILRPNTDA